MKILMINSVCGIKSTGRICTDLAGALMQKGHEVRIAYGREEVPEAVRPLAVPIGSKAEVYAHGGVSMLFDGAGLGSVRATKRFLAWVREYDPDIIHLHNLHGYYINLPLLFDYLKTARKKVIWTLHDCWPFTGHSPSCDQAGCEKWRSGCGGCPLKGDYPRSFTDFSRRNFRWKREAFLGIEDMTLVSPSKWLAGLAAQSFLGAYPVKVIPNGIDESRFRPLGDSFKREAGIEKMILAVSGNWYDRRKGLPDILRLSQMLPGNCKIVLAGLTPAQMEGLPKNVLGLPKTNSVSELAKLYSAADVLLNPTYSDNFPTVNLEALCCGTPVLTYRTGGSPEPIEDGCGAVVDQGDLDGILRELPNCMAAKEHVTEIASDFQCRFSRRRAEENYLSLYL